MKKSTSSPPDEREWNFASVPDYEVDICFIYEYAREHAQHSKRWQKLTKRGKDGRSKFPVELIGRIELVFGKHTLLWFFDPSFLVTPWQSIEKKLRADEAKRFNQQKSGAQSFKESISLNITLERDLPTYAPAGAKDFDSWVRLDTCFHDEKDQREYGFLAVNWNYPDGELINEFKAWLDAKRGDRRAVESQQGKNKTRQYLKALGAKRLLDSGLTVPEAMKLSWKDQSGVLHQLYDSERAWSKAKNKIVPAILKHLFPVEK